MHIIKTWCLNKNYTFPKCTQCEKEMSAITITSKELNTLKQDIIYKIVFSDLLIINALADDEHVIFLCKKCFNIKRSCYNEFFRKIRN